MGKIKQRLTITPAGILVGWRKLHPERHAYSGQLMLEKSVRSILHLRTGYVSYLEFDFITHWPRLADHWEDHFLGEKEGVFIALPVSAQASASGPVFL